MTPNYKGDFTMFKFKRFTATAFFTVNGHSVKVNLPFSYLTKRGARVNCRRMVEQMKKNTICYKDAKIDHIEVYDVVEGGRKPTPCSVRY